MKARAHFQRAQQPVIFAAIELGKCCELHERVLLLKFVFLHLSLPRGGAHFLCFVSRPAAIRLVIHHDGVHASDA